MKQLCKQSCFHGLNMQCVVILICYCLSSSYLLSFWSIQGRCAVRHFIYADSPEALLITYIGTLSGLRFCHLQPAKAGHCRVERSADSGGLLYCAYTCTFHGPSRRKENQDHSQQRLQSIWGKGSVFICACTAPPTMEPNAEKDIWGLLQIANHC